MNAPRPLIAGNWKMNGLTEGATALTRDLLGRLPDANGGPEMLVCPPSTLIARVGELIDGAPMSLGGQDCHVASSGAHTGDISAAMLADAGCQYVIVGHSERRADHGEGDALVRAKAEAAAASGLVPIVCVGETLEQRDAGEAVAVVTGQVRGSIPEGQGGSALVVAYEPVWAIGTGRTPTAADIAEVHDAIRACLNDIAPAADAIRILYGGSVKPENAVEILAIDNVNGALVGGASLKGADFWAIREAAPTSPTS